MINCFQSPLTQKSEKTNVFGGIYTYSVTGLECSDIHSQLRRGLSPFSCCECSFETHHQTLHVWIGLSCLSISNMDADLLCYWTCCE